MPKVPPRTLLLGMGNPILSDDAIGVRLAKNLQQRLPKLPNLDVVEDCSVGGLNLLHLLEGYERLVVIDSIKTNRGVPGDVYRFSGAALGETMHLSNVHDANFATALELGRRMGMRLPEPDAIHVFAVEVEDNQTFSEQMTPALEVSFHEIAAAVLHEVTTLLS